MNPIPAPTVTERHREAAKAILPIFDKETLQYAAEILAEHFPDGWRPIAEAPRDGTEILGWRNDCGIILIRWTSPEAFCTEKELEDMGEDSASKEDWFCADFATGCRLEGSEAPTHFQPLPEPPKE